MTYHSMERSRLHISRLKHYYSYFLNHCRFTQIFSSLFTSLLLSSGAGSCCLFWAELNEGTRNATAAPLPTTRVAEQLPVPLPRPSLLQSSSTFHSPPLPVLLARLAHQSPLTSAEPASALARAHARRSSFAFPPKMQSCVIIRWKVAFNQKLDPMTRMFPAPSLSGVIIIGPPV